MTAGRPLYLDSAPTPVAALYHPAPSGSPPATAVLLCAPWGWDEVASYRSRRRWAERLALAGHPTLRFDLPAWADSGGGPRDEGLLDAWVGAVGAAASWLRAESGAPRVALLGLGLGGLLAREAIARGSGVEELITWAAPRNGKAFAREARAFSALQEWSGDGGDGSLLGEGAIEAGGFLISGATKAALAAVDPAVPDGSPLRRALLLGRDGAAAEDEVATALKGAGVEVARLAGNGWGELVVHPEQTQLSEETAAAVENWLAAAEGAPASGGATPPPSSDSLTLQVGASAVKETPLRFELGFGAAYGVLAEPATGADGDLCVLFLNAGAVRHVGPNRLWAEAARRTAAAGTPALRLDLEGIGEADGDEARLRAVGEFFDARYAEQVGAVLADLAKRGVGQRFVLVGLCSGAYWSFRAAVAEPRVRSALMLNSGAFVWEPDLYTERGIRDLSRLRDPAWWRRLVTGKLTRKGAAEGARLVGAKLRQISRRLIDRLARRGGQEPEADLETELDLLAAQGTRLVLAFSDGEALLEEMEAEGLLAQLEQRPNVEVERLPGADHTLRPLLAQAAAHALIDRQIEAARQEVPAARRQRSSSIA